MMSLLVDVDGAVVARSRIDTGASGFNELLALIAQHGGSAKRRHMQTNGGQPYRQMAWRQLTTIVCEIHFCREFPM